MTSRALYLPDQRILELDRLTAADFGLVESLHGSIKRGSSPLICLDENGVRQGELLIVLRGKRFWAKHFPGGSHDASHVIEQESTEHRSQKDYWLRAATDAGFDAVTEFRTGNRTRLDVAINGAVKTGVEIQRSPIHLRELKSRTTKSANAGWSTVWFSDADSLPQWFGQVPTVGCNRLPEGWITLPRKRAATATGLRHIEARRCVPGGFQRCPEGKKVFCGRFHPAIVPWIEMRLDDVAEQAPLGEILAIQNVDTHIYLVDKASATKCSELLGRDCVYRPPRTSALPADALSRFARCRNTHRDQICAECGFPLGPTIPVGQSLHHDCRAVVAQREREQAGRTATAIEPAVSLNQWH